MLKIQDGGRYKSSNNQLKYARTITALMIDVTREIKEWRKDKHMHRKARFGWSVCALRKTTASSLEAQNIYFLHGNWGGKFAVHSWRRRQGELISRGGLSGKGQSQITVILEEKGAVLTRAHTGKYFVDTQTRGRLCHPCKSHPGKALSLSCVWATVVLDGGHVRVNKTQSTRLTSLLTKEASKYKKSMPSIQTWLHLTDFITQLKFRVLVNNSLRF